MRVTGAILVIAVVALIGATKADDDAEAKKAQAKEMLRNMAQDCKEKEGATDGDVDGFVDEKTPETKVQKCLHSCMQEQFGISDGKQFQKEGFKQVGAMMFGKDEEKMKQVNEVAEECSGVKNDDRCNLAMDIENCLKSALEKRGIKQE
ncbi:general odorant-binding protein 19d-like [Uranotaenia lowii]|uniref:general odorant-binding protein 19d-like n=1 Tax=Uranotaenia lowii TaxID=190385 RepID=UPI0024794D70|nr:general odorant-binding protein 19d-like [Uranotaenia lowii]